MIDPLKIHALADGEVGKEEMAGLCEEVSACEKSSAELQSIKNLKSFMATAEPVECEESWKACVKRLNEIDKTRKIENSVSRYAWSLCGAFFLAIVVGGYFSRTGANVVRSGDVPRMVAGLIPFASFKGTTPQAARQWLSANAANVPMPNERLHVIGGMVGKYKDGHKILRLNLQDRQGALALIVIYGADQLDGLEPANADFQQGVIDDMRCVAWHKDDMALLLVGDRTADELQAIATGITPR